MSPLRISETTIIDLDEVVGAELVEHGGVNFYSNKGTIFGDMKTIHNSLKDMIPLGMDVSTYAKWWTALALS